jgi:hypothetical protein
MSKTSTTSEIELWFDKLSDNTKKEMNLLKFKNKCIEHVKRKYDVNSIL